jgi:hypothetical protein
MFAFALWGACASVQADVRLPALFSDHMVLQQDMTLPIWGWADPGEKVTVSIAGQTKSSTAGSDGKWIISLDPLKASSEAQIMTISSSNISKSPNLQITDVLIGEVWLCSGQSNMQMGLSITNNATAERQAAKFPQIRLFEVKQTPQLSPQETCEGKWEICGPDNVGRFSAAAYLFGQEIHKGTKFPVGLIESSLGGTIIEAWTSMDAQSKLKEYKTIDEYAKIMSSKPWNEKDAMEKYEKDMAAWTIASEKAKAGNTPAPKQPRKPFPPNLHKCQPSVLFNSLINPVIPYAIRGTIWYQGESNAYLPHADLYGLQLETLIKDWRARWGYDFPFAWVQLPEYEPKKEPAISYWPLIQEEMLKSSNIPNTGMAVTLGLGEANNVHPKNKKDVAKRLALWALAEVYKQKDVAYQGPLPARHEIRGREIVVSFKHTDGGLIAKGGAVKGFMISGEDQKWMDGTARIDGNTVIVSNPDVSKPLALRYAWGCNPAWSLMNGAGLPASPFRTDTWKIVPAGDGAHVEDNQN